MKDFVFQNTTKVYFGKNQLENLGKEVKSYGSKVLLIYGGGSIKRIGLYDKVIAELKASGLEIFELAGVEPNPRHTTVNRGAKICRENQIDVLLAVGGGSTIDCAKGIAAACYYAGDAWDLVIGKAPVTNALPICTVLTIAATDTLALNDKLSDLNIDDKNFALMAQKACNHGQLKGFVTLTPKDVEEIFRKSL